MIKTMRFILLALIAGLMLIPASAFATAVTSQQTQDVTCTIDNDASLTVSPASFTFTSANGGTNEIAASTTTSISASVRTATGNSPTLDVDAPDLNDSPGTDTIPVGNITWTDSGDTGFSASGTMANSSVNVATWSASGVYTGTLSYSFLNSWSYPVGVYTTTLTYTLTAP